MSMHGVGAPGPGPGDVLNDLRSGRIRDPQARLRTATSLLESNFYQQLFQAMRATVPEGGALPAGSGEDMFASMLDQHVADAAALSSDRGLGQALYRLFADAVGTVDPAATETTHTDDPTEAPTGSGATGPLARPAPSPGSGPNR